MTELERLELDVAAIERKLADPVYTERTPQERLDEERELRNELRARLETQRELARQVPIVPGGLPADGVGRWAPLPLFDKPASEDASDLPPPSLELVEIEPDFAAISRQVAELLRSTGPKVPTLKRLALRWKQHPATFRLVIAALQTVRASGTANMLRPKPAPIVARFTDLPPTEWLTCATELPDEHDGLTALQRVVLTAMRTIAPPGHPFVKLSTIVAELEIFELQKVEHALISLGHPSLRRRLVVELEHLAFSGPVRDAIEQSRVCQQSFETEFRVHGHDRLLPLTDLLLAFIEHRREVAVKKLDRFVNQARVRAQGAEAVCLAITLLEPVLEVMRKADEDTQAIGGLMNFMQPAHRDALKSLPFPASHDYATGFTEAQARHLLIVRKLASRRMENARQDWATLLSARDEAVRSLSDRQAILEVLRAEFRAALVRFDEPRRTQLSSW